MFFPRCYLQTLQEMEKKWMGTFQCPLTCNLCSLCSQPNDIIDKEEHYYTPDSCTYQMLQIIYFIVKCHCHHLSLVTINLDTLPISPCTCLNRCKVPSIGADVSKRPCPVNSYHHLVNKILFVCHISIFICFKEIFKFSFELFKDPLFIHEHLVQHPCIYIASRFFAIYF